MLLMLRGNFVYSIAENTHLPFCMGLLDNIIIHVIPIFFINSTQTHAYIYIFTRNRK